MTGTQPHAKTSGRLRRLLAYEIPHPRQSGLVGDAGQATSLTEIAVVMLLVGILATMGGLTWTRLQDRAADAVARTEINNALAVADQIYSELRPSGQRCYSGRDCTTVVNADTVTALEEQAGGEIQFDDWDNPDNPRATTSGVVYVQTAGNSYIAGKPANGHWIRLHIRSSSGATFCAIKVAQANDPNFEGTGFMSVDSDDSAVAGSEAHCGGVGGSALNHDDPPAGADTENAVLSSCVYGGDPDGTTNSSEDIANGDIVGHTEAIDADNAECWTDRLLVKPYAYNQQGD